MSENNCKCGHKINPAATICGICKAKEAFFATGNRKKLLLQSGVPPRIAQKTLSLYPQSTINKNAPNCTLFTKLHDVGLFYSGKAGVGKTVNAACILLHDMEAAKTTRSSRDHTRTHLFITCQDMLEDIRSGFVSKENVQTKYRDVDFLVIDDLGVEKVTDWVFSTLYAIIDYRFNHYKTTVYTSNYTLDQIAKKLGDARITRRIAEVSDIILLKV